MTRDYVHSLENSEKRRDKVEGRESRGKKNEKEKQTIKSRQQKENEINEEKENSNVPLVSVGTG